MNFRAAAVARVLLFDGAKPENPEPMQTSNSQAPLAPRAPRKTADRRTLLRLRDLCDEVLASYRVAHESEVISDRDRADARAMLGRMTPGLAR